MTRTSGRLFHSGPVLLVAVLIVIVLQMLYAARNSETLATHGYLGPDSYMRMMRVEKLMETGDWFDRISDRTNAPYGELLPWGRPLDAVLVTVAAVLSLFADTTRSAVYWAGVALGPLLALALIPIWSWGTRPFLGGGTYLMILVLTPLAFALSFNLQAGRADHHGFLALMFIFQLCAAFRMATGHGGRRLPFLIGIVGGVMVWASIMELLSQIVLTLWLCLRFARGEPAASRDLLLYVAGVAVAFTAALPLERGTTDLLVPDANKLSVAHWLLAVMAAVTWCVIDLHLRHRRCEPSLRSRAGLLVLGGGVPMGAVAILFPTVLHGPSAPYDADVVAFYFDHILEFQPLLPTDSDKLVNFTGHMGPVFIALGFIAWDYRKAATGVRSIYEILLLGFAVYVPMTLWVGRFAIYAGVLFLVPWAMTTARVMTWTRTLSVGRRDIPVRGIAVGAVIVGHVLLSGLVQTVLPPKNKATSKLELAAIADFLTAYARRTATPGKTPDILLTYITWGPELAWRTPYSVVGAPYANVDALRDTNRVMNATTDEEARRVIDRRGMTLILFNQTKGEDQRSRNGMSMSWSSRLGTGALPEWLVRVPLPETLSGRFKLFRVVRNG